MNSVFTEYTKWKINDWKQVLKWLIRSRFIEHLLKNMIIQFKNIKCLLSKWSMLLRGFGNRWSMRKACAGRYAMISFLLKCKCNVVFAPTSNTNLVHRIIQCAMCLCGNVCFIAIAKCTRVCCFIVCVKLPENVVGSFL